MNRLSCFNHANSLAYDKISNAKGHYLDNKFDLHASAGCNIFGYSNPMFLDALVKNYDNITTSYWKIKTPVWNKLENQLTDIFGDLYNFYYPTLTGSDAVDTALKLAWNATGKSTVLVRKNSYHSGSVSGWQMMQDKSFSKNWPDVQFVEFFDNLQDTIDIVGKENIGAVLIDTVQWHTALYEQSEDYWLDFQNTIDKNNLLLCVDEIITGIGRMGYWSHSIALGLKPDILILGKALAAGHENFNLALYNNKIQDLLDNKWQAIGNTRSNNTQGALIATENLQFIIENNILQQIKNTVIPYCKSIKDQFINSGVECYQAGAMVQAYPKLLNKFQEEIRQKGLYHNWDHFWHLPFYDITEEEQQNILKIIKGTLDELQ
jgi:adenosylmethionine-8-amino-7-oxononanoate aminotransferase